MNLAFSLFLLSLSHEVFCGRRIIEQYEKQLNRINEKINKFRSPVMDGKVKRYRCVEEYVTIDRDGNELTESRGDASPRVAPPVAQKKRTKSTSRKRAHGVKTYKTSHYPIVHTLPIQTTKMRKKPRPTVSIQVQKTKMTTPPLPISEESADELIEKLYLSESAPKLSIETKPIPTTMTPEAFDLPSPVRPQLRPSTTFASNSVHNSVDNDYSFEDSEYTTLSREQNDNRRFSPRRKEDNYEQGFEEYEYYEELPLYRSERRPRKKYFRELQRPLLAQHVPPVYRDTYRRNPVAWTPPNRLPVSNYRLPVANPRSAPRRPIPVPMSRAPATFQQRPPPPQQMMGMIQRQPLAPQIPQPLSPAAARYPSPRTVLSPTVQMTPPPATPLPYTLVPEKNQQIQMKTDSEKPSLEDANAENCARIPAIAAQFGITDVSAWARSNCATLQMFAPGATCEQIWHFVDSCKKKHFL